MRRIPVGYYRWLSEPQKVQRILFNDSTTLLLLDRPNISAHTIDSLSTIRRLILVKNYAPAGLDFAALTSLESLSLFDGDLTDDLRTAIADLAKSEPKALRYLEIPRWGPNFSVSFQASNITKIVGLNDVTTIDGPNAFADCAELTTISLPELTSITGGSSFYLCPKLTSVSFPKLKSATGGNFLFECRAIKSVTLPELENLAGNCHLAYCSVLASAYVPRLAGQLPGRVFDQVPALNTLKISDQLTSAGIYFFSGSWRNIGLYLIGRKKADGSVHNGIVGTCGVLRPPSSFTFSLGEEIRNSIQGDELIAYLNEILALTRAGVPRLTGVAVGNSVLDLESMFLDITQLIHVEDSLIDVIKMSGKSYTWSGSAWIK
ncbi:MAG: leucine-rich repeat domain-containing protein [Holosporales bacterium]|jgi:hypothetical protein|nr:leucine-rich repeat domain-containing protein [Holosporales bacterium]